MDGKFHTIASKRALLNLFADEKESLKIFFKKTETSFRSDKAKFVALTAEFYDKQHRP